MNQPIVLHATLRRLRRLLRGAMAVAGMGRLVQGGFLVALASFTLDRLLRLPPAVRVVLLAAFGGLMVWLVLRQVVRPLTRPLGDLDLAIEVERRLPVHRGVLASAVSLAGDEAGGSVALRAAAVRQAEQAARGVHARSLVGWRGPLRSAGLALVLLGLLVCVAFYRPATASLWFRRNVLLAEEPWPRRTRLRLVGFPDGVRHVPRGADIEVCALADGVVPEVARLRVRPVEGDGRRTVTMQRRPPNEFAASLQQVTTSAVLQAGAGDGVTPEVRLQVVPRPQVDSARMLVHPPEYISPEPVEMPWNSTEFSVPAGSRVSVELTASARVSGGAWSLHGGPERKMNAVGRRTFGCSFPVRRDIECEFVLSGEHGIRMDPPLRAAFRAVPDEAPDVRLTGPGVGSLLVPLARLPLRVVARDDYAASTGRLQVSAGGTGEPLSLSLWDGHEGAVRRSEYVLDLGEVTCEPGDRLEVTALVRDNREAAGANVGRSMPLAFRIVRVQELLRSLLLQQEDLRRDLEQHIVTEKGISRRLGEGSRAVAVEREQANLTAELMKVAEAYRHILQQLRNNRVLEPASYRARVAEIVTPLEALSWQEGAVAEAAEAVQTAPDRAPEHARQAVGQMERVRQNMLLMEGTAAVTASVIEIGEQQRSVLERTGEGPQGVLDWLEGGE